ncbi:MAG: ion channel [Rhodopila sp.]
MARQKPKRLPAPIPIGRKEFGLAKRGVPRFDLRDPYHIAFTLPWPLFITATLAGWLALNLVFALLYVLSPGAIGNARPGSFGDAFFFSIETLATVGYGVMAPATTYGHVVSALEIVVGMTFTAILTGLLFVRFSRPKARIMYAEDAVVCTRDGRPVLMLRIASGRLTVMTNVQVRLFVLLYGRNADGSLVRRIHDMPLQESRQPILLMPWTLVHVIDAASPLHGFDAEALVRTDAWLFLAVEARDHVLSAMVHDVKAFPASQVRFGMRYAEAVMPDAAGRTVIDLSRLSLLEPDDGTAGQA